MAVCPKSLEDLQISKLVVNGLLLANVDKEMYVDFIMTSHDDEDDIICKENGTLNAWGSMLLSKFGHFCCTDDVKNCYSNYLNFNTDNILNLLVNFQQHPVASIRRLPQYYSKRISCNMALSVLKSRWLP